MESELLRREFVRLGIRHISLHDGSYTIGLLDLKVGAHHTSSMSDEMLVKAIEVLKADDERFKEEDAERQARREHQLEIQRHNEAVEQRKVDKRNQKRLRRMAKGGSQ